MLKELRDLVMLLPDPAKVKALRAQADLLTETIRIFAKTPGREELIVLNGVWSRAEWMLRTWQPPVIDPSPFSGDAEAAELAA